MSKIPKTRFGLSLKDIEAINRVLRTFPEIESVRIYGSRAKGNYKSGSDIDLAFIGNLVPIDILLRAGTMLDELNLPYEFDLCIYHQIKNPQLKEHIDRIGIEFTTAGQFI